MTGYTQRLRQLLNNCYTVIKVTPEGYDVLEMCQGDLVVIRNGRMEFVETSEQIDEILHDLSELIRIGWHDDQRRVFMPEICEELRKMK